jgi:Carboxypeptidase regulatory-like domain/TonB-dependent Receptor Plug Domain
MKNISLLRVRLVVGLGFALVIAGISGSARAAGEQFGRVRGVVTDENGQPLASVTMVATSPALIGEPRIVQSDDHGRYEIVNLPPGLYSIELSYTGLQAIKKQATVRQGEASTLNIVYKLVAEDVEPISVMAPRALTRPDSTHTGATREADTLARLPTGRSYQNAAQQVPGVSGGANPNIKGGLAGENRYLLDDMDITDPVSGTFTSNQTFESIQSVEILTGGADAEYNALGGVINIVPKGGSDTFHALVAAYVNHYRLTNGGNLGANIWEGQQPFNRTDVGPTQRYEATANIGGPIVKRKLWYGLSYQYIYTANSLAKGPPFGIAPYDIRHPTRRFVAHYIRARLDYAPTSKHRFKLSVFADPTVIDNTGQANTYLGTAETHQDQGGQFSSLRWDWLARDNVTASLLVGLNLRSLSNGPQGRFGAVDNAGCAQFTPVNCAWDPNQPRHINTLDGTSWYQGPTFVIHERNRIQIDPSVSLRGSLAGRHTAKVGIQGQVVWRYRYEETPGGVVYNDTPAPGRTLESGLCDPSTGINCDRRTNLPTFETRQRGYAAGIFLQDHWWTSLEWLTINPGVRFDYGATYNRNGERATSLFGIGPRLGLTADVTKDGRNILFAYYGRANNALPLDVVANLDDAEVGGSKTYQWDPATRDFSTLIQQTGGPGGTLIAKDVKIPHTDEITGGARREFLPGTVVGVEYTWRRFSNEWDTIEQNRIWDPTGLRVIDYADKTQWGRAISLQTTPTNPRTYQGVIISSEGKPTDRLDYHVSHTLSWNSYRGPMTSNPRQALFNEGWANGDIRHYTRLYVAYYLLSRLNLGAVFTYRTGDPISKNFYNRELNNRTLLRSPSGTAPAVPNDPNGIAELRNAALTQLDLKMILNLMRPSTQQSLNLVADIFNVFDSRTPIGFVNTDLPTYGQITARQDPLRMQVGLTYTY